MMTTMIDMTASHGFQLQLQLQQLLSSLQLHALRAVIDRKKKQRGYLKGTTGDTKAPATTKVVCPVPELMIPKPA
jgi:NAD(P)H-dependent FMN reductase